ncbi:insulinase family protein [Salinimicrobium sp. TIG7-5_MAKvit]|uniref:M16 family metallopeptidase n=1 Tax=Salinimicrobium sp. TIG7-5_MAKvit TaxID=3121289 RepID=UPI003C6DFB0F
MKIKNQFFFLFLFVLTDYGVKGQNNGDIFQEKIPLLDTAVRYGKLDNGFTYYLRRHDIPKKTVEFHMVVKGGFFHENDDQLEYSHLIEHMGTIKTKNFPNLDEHLWEMGGYNHAGTRNSHTYYWASLPSGEKEIKTGLRVIRDWAQNLDFPQTVVDVERGAVLGEMRTADVYGTWLDNAIEEKVVKDTGQALYDQQKHKKNVELFNRKAFLEFYDNWYRPDLEAAIIVGDINVDSMEKEVKRLFSDLKMPKKPKNGQKLLDAQRVKLNGENTFQMVRDTVNSSFRLQIISKHLNSNGFGLKTRSDFKKWIIQQLYKEIVESRSTLLDQQFNPPFSEFRLSFGLGGFGRNKEINGTRMTVKFASENQQQVKKNFIEAVVAWKQIHTNIGISELQNAKEEVQNRIIGKVVFSHDLAEAYRSHFLKGEAALAPEVKENLIKDILNEIDLQEMQNALFNYGNLNKNVDFLIFNGENHNVPKFNLFKRWLKEARTMEVKAIEPLEALESLEDVIQFPLDEIKPIKSISTNVIDVTRVTLQNGIEVLFKPSNPASQRQKGLVTIDAFRPNEIPISHRKEYLAASIVPEYMGYAGAGSFSKFELGRFLKEKGMRLLFFSDANYQRIHGRSKEKDIDELFNLLFLYSYQPRRSTEGFVALKADYNQPLKAYVPNSGSRSVLEDKMESLWYPKVPVLGISDLENLKLDDVFNAYKRWFSDFSDYTFIITGDFNTEQIFPIISKKLSVFPVGNRRPTDNGLHSFPLKRINETIRLKNIDQAFVRLYFPTTAGRDVKTQIEVQLLTKALYERVWNRLRQGSYSPTTGGDWMDIKNGVFSFSINFDSELGNEEKMIQNAIEEFRKLREFGVDQSWLDAAISDEAAAFDSGLSKFGIFNFWRDYLKEKLVNHEDLEQEVLQYTTMMKHFITLEDINTAAKKYLSEENLQQFIFIPEFYDEAKVEID